MPNSLSVLFQKRMAVILLLGFASGLPLALTGSTLQAWYATAGVDLATIGALSLIGQPYVYKFLWAPLLDRYAPLGLGRRRGWILSMQVLLVLALVLMAFTHPGKHPLYMAFLALIVATSSATQDIGIDAYRTELLSAEQYGLGASLNGWGYRIAMLVSGALALILAEYWGWTVSYLVMAALMAVEIFVTLWAPKPVSLREPASLREAVVEPWLEFIKRRYAVLLLVFIVIYKLTDAFGLALMTPFLIKGLGFSLAEVGSIAKLVSLAASFSGTLIGGLLFLRLGMFKSLLYFGILQTITNFSFLALAYLGKNYAMMAFALFSENFFSGMGSVAFVAFLMALCNKHYTATQYALFSALAAVGRVFVGPPAGWVAEQWGWPMVYWIAVFLGIPALLLLVWLRNRLDFSGKTIHV